MPATERVPWKRILRHTLPNGRKVPTSFGPLYEGLLSRLLYWNPGRRLTAAQVLQHSFLTELDGLQLPAVRTTQDM